MRKRLSILLVFVVFSIMSKAATYYAVTSGTWGDAIWSTNPTATSGSTRTLTSTDDVVINSGVTIASYGNNSLGTVTLNSLTINGSCGAPTTALNVYGNFINNGTFTYVYGATINFNGTTTISGSAATSLSVVVIAASATLTAPSSGTLSVTGNFTNNGTFNPNGGTISFNNTTLGGTSSYTFNNLINNNTALPSAVTITGNWTNNTYSAGTSGTIIFGGNTTITGSSATNFNNIVINASSTLILPSGATTNINGNITNNGTLNANGGTVNFTGTTAISSTSTLSFNNVTVSGTLTAPSGTMNVAGSFTTNGTFNPNGGTVNFNSASASIVSYNSRFNNISIDPGATLTATSGLIHVAGNWINNGTFSYGTGIIDFNGTTTISGSATTSFYSVTIAAASSLTAPSGTLNIAGNWTNSGTFNNNNGTVNFNGTAANQSIAGTLTGATGRFYNITFNGTGGSWSFGNVATEVTNNFTITNGTVTAPSTTLTVGGNWNNSGTFTHNSGTVTFNSTATGKTIAGTLTGTIGKFYNITFNGAGGAWSFSNNAEVANIFTTSAGSVTAPSGTLTVGGNWVNNSTFAHNNGTVSFTATAAQAVSGSAALGFYNLITNTTNTITLSRAITVANALTLTAGVLSNSTNLSVAAAATVTRTAGTLSAVPTYGTLVNVTYNGTTNVNAGYELAPSSGTVGALTLASTGNYTLQSAAPISATTVSALTVSSSGTLTTSSNVLTVSNNVSITTGGLTATNNINVGGSWSNNGTFTANTSTVTFNSTVAGKTIAGTLTGATGKFYKIVFNGVGGTWLFSNNTDVASDFTITNGTVTNPSGVLNVAGNWTNNAAFTHNSGTVNFTGTTTISGSITNSFYNVGIAASSSLTAPASGTINVAGTWSNSGTFTHNNSTVNLNGTNAQSIGTTTFYNLTNSNSSNTVTATSNITVNNILNLNAGTFADGSYIITVAGSIAGSGNHTGSGKITMTGSTATISGATLQNIELNNAAGFGLTGSTTVNGALTFTAGKLSIGSNTLTLAGSLANMTATNSITGSASSNIFITGSGTVGTLYMNQTTDGTTNNIAVFSINRNNTGIITAGNKIVIGSALALSNGTLDMGTNLLGGSSFVVSGTGTLKTQNTSTTAIPAGLTWSGTVEYNSASSQTIITGTYNNLIASTGGTKSLVNTATVNGNLSIGSSTTFDVTTNNYAVNVGGNWSNSGTFISRSGTVSFNGTSSQNITNANGENFYGLTVNKSSGTLSLNNVATVTNLLNVTSGIFDLSNSNLTLKSTSIFSTALVGNVGGTIVYSGAGRFVAERFVNSIGNGTGYRGYRTYTSSVYTDNSYVWDNWQEKGVNNNSTVVNSNTYYYGTQITGTKTGGAAGANNATNGLDITTTGSASMWTYNTSDGYDAVTNTKTLKLLPYKGYYLIIRGDRTYNLVSSTAASTFPFILRSTGKLLTGTVTINNTGTTYYLGNSTPQTDNTFKLNTIVGNSNYGFSLIGNPYMAPINWSTVYSASTNISPYYWVWDQSIAGGSGGYCQMDNLGNRNVASNNNGYIQPGQAFFIQNDNIHTNPSLVITEAAKSISASNLVSVFGVSAPVSKMKFSLQKNISSVATEVDGALALFSSDYSNTVGNEDGIKLSNAVENICIFHNNDSLGIERRFTPSINDTINLRMWTITSGTNYTFKVVTAEFAYPSLKVYIRDNYLNTKTLVTADTTSITFTPTTTVTTYRDRFSIVFGGTTILPVNLTSIKAYKQNQNNIVEWSAADEASSSITNYEIERSSTGQSFTTIGSVVSKNSNGNSDYSFVDASPLSTDNYYRVKMISATGNVIYSQIVVVRSSVNVQASVTVYPNPAAKGSLITVQLNNVQQGNYVVELFNIAGERILVKTITNNGASSSQTVQLNSNMATGLYRLKLSNNDNKTVQEQTLLIQ